MPHRFCAGRAPAPWPVSEAARQNDPSRGDFRRQLADNEPARFRQDYLSVNFSSMRRLRRYASSLSPGSRRWLSAKPAAASRAGGTPWATAYRTTEIARAADSSQFEANWALLIGR